MLSRIFFLCQALAFMLFLNACGGGGGGGNNSSTGASTSTSGTTATNSLRVLLIGNSYTHYNDGLDVMLKGLAPAHHFSRIAPGGFTLKRHWETASTRDTIRNGNWDVVVLQEQSQTPVLNYTDFEAYGALLEELIRQSGARPLFLMTWERPDSVSHGVTTYNLSANYRYLANRLGADVTAAGETFAAVLRETPGSALYSHDGDPTRRGSYLAACELYQSLFGSAPDSQYGGGLSASDASYLRGAASRF